jgi:hypothetical protein
MSALLVLPRSTASAVIVKWKLILATTGQPQSSRPHKPTTEIQTPSGSNVSTRTVRRELREMGFHGRVAAYKPKITRSNAKRRLEWCKAHRHWTLEKWKCVLWSDESPGECYLPECRVPTVKFGGGGRMVWGCF